MISWRVIFIPGFYLEVQPRHIIAGRSETSFECEPGEMGEIAAGAMENQIEIELPGIIL
jgi:hypothetical protein